MLSRSSSTNGNNRHGFFSKFSATQNAVRSQHSKGRNIYCKTIDDVLKYDLVTFAQIVVMIKSPFLSWSGGGRVVRWCLVNFQCRGVLLSWIIVGQRPTALAVGAGGSCLTFFSHLSFPSSLSLSLGDGPI